MITLSAGNLYIVLGTFLIISWVRLQTHQISGHLKREIGLFGATALGIGAIIGSGIFIVTGIVAGIAGPAMIISVVIAGIISLFSALSVAELSAYLPEEGGTYAFAQKLISPFAGYIAGWIWIFSNIFVGAAVSLGFAHYFASLVPAVPVKIIAVIICLIFIIINYLGLKESTLLNNVLVTLKVLILLFFIAFGLGFFNITHFTPSGTFRNDRYPERCCPHLFCVHGFCPGHDYGRRSKRTGKNHSPLHLPRTGDLDFSLYPGECNCGGACRDSRSCAVRLPSRCCNHGHGKSCSSAADFTQGQ